MDKITIEAKVDNLNEVLAFIDEKLEANNCPMKIQTQIDIAVEEIFVNIASYAYTPDTGLATISAE
ncbi:MAG: ATP-binding protein, partial [Lachnospiraceae bacterium]|nr:ATP-binding protein [Lachnospiraceae bacterium]